MKYFVLLKQKNQKLNYNANCSVEFQCPNQQSVNSSGFNNYEAVDNNRLKIICTHFMCSLKEF